MGMVVRFLEGVSGRQSGDFLFSFFIQCCLYSFWYAVWDDRVGGHDLLSDLL